MKYKVELRATVVATTFVTVDAASVEEAKTLATGIGECDAHTEWHCDTVCDGTVTPVNAYPL